MALAYPEGECFFQRKGLQSGSYQADKPEDFYSHVMIEFIWNWPGDVEGAASKKTHPRSEYHIGGGDRQESAFLGKVTVHDTKFGVWKNLPISYGPSNDKITRRVQHNLLTYYERLKQAYKGASKEPWFMFVSIPSLEERWIWIDLLAPIRAVYLPVSWSASKDHPDLCSFVAINFALDRTINIWRGGEEWAKHPTKSLEGLSVHYNHTVGLDVGSLIELLCLPRQLRRDNPYNLKLITIRRGDSLSPNVDVSHDYSDQDDLSWKSIAKSNFGLDLMWRPPEKNEWAENFLNVVINNTLGMIPVIGPLILNMFPVGMALLTSGGHSEKAYQCLKDLAPQNTNIQKNDAQIREQIIAAVEETRKFMPNGWEEIQFSFRDEAIDDILAIKPIIEVEDRALPMLLMNKILESQGNRQTDDEGEELPETDSKGNPIVEAGKDAVNTVTQFFD